MVVPLINEFKPTFIVLNLGLNFDSTSLNPISIPSSTISRIIEDLHKNCCHNLIVAPCIYKPKSDETDRYKSVDNVPQQQQQQQQNFETDHDPTKIRIINE